MMLHSKFIHFALLGLSGVSSSETTTPSVTVNVNATSSSTGSTGTTGTTTGNTTQILPLILYTNGTVAAFPFLLGATATSLLGFGSLLNFFPFFPFG